MAVKNYDAKDVTIIWNGIIVEGYADGTFVSVARDNPSFNKIVGSDGEGARAQSNDRSGTITLTLMQTSITNDLFSSAIAVDEQTGDGVGPFLMKDQNGTTLCEAQTAWLQKPADQTFAREIETREWIIETTDLVIFGGGASQIG